ncbi:hypothetical protein IZY60_13565, partial [Lutibacter sp. B2]|nr:hypothetical protein [Lutibacter sp. B2]
TVTGVGTVDTVTNVTSVDTVDTVTGVGTVDTVTNVTSVDTVDTITYVAEVKKITDTVPVNLVGAGFTEDSTQVAVTTSTVYILNEDTSEKDIYSFYVKNEGDNVTVQLEISPDGTTYINDTSTALDLSSGSEDVLVAAKYLKNTRLAIVGAGTSTVTAYYNGHN